MMRSYGGPSHVGETATRNFTQVGEFRGQFARSLRRAIGNDDLAQLPLHQRAEHAANRAAGTENEHTLAGEGESEIVLQIGHQPEPVGVVAQQRGLLEECNGVDGFGALRARREFVYQFRSRLLVRQRDIEALESAGEQAQRLAAKILGRNVEQAIHQILRRGLGEHAVDERRPAMGDGVTRNSILIRRL